MTLRFKVLPTLDNLKTSWAVLAGTKIFLINVLVKVIPPLAVRIGIDLVCPTEISLLMLLISVIENDIPPLLSAAA